MQPLPYETVRGDGVVLRPPRPGDAADLVAACADPLIERFVPSLPSPCGDTEAGAWIATAPDRRGLVIADPDPQRLAGGRPPYPPFPFDPTPRGRAWVAAP